MGAGWWTARSASIAALLQVVCQGGGGGTVLAHGAEAGSSRAPHSDGANWYSGNLLYTQQAACLETKYLRQVASRLDCEEVTLTVGLVPSIWRMTLVVVLRHFSPKWCNQGGCWCPVAAHASSSRIQEEVLF
jgi:hypothetical protein